jgi:signal transduction histidine kinase
MIRKKIDESNEIINNLLFYSRLRPPVYESVDLVAIIHECVEIAKDRYRTKKITMDEDVDAIIGTIVDVDPLQMREVFNNLLNNANDAVYAETGRIKIEAEQSDEMITLRITDNGIGISPDEMAKVFEPFFTTKAKGTGLGLTVCKQIITFHGGRIDLMSRKEQGTTVTLQLPVRRAQSWL